MGVADVVVPLEVPLAKLPKKASAQRLLEAAGLKYLPRDTRKCIHWETGHSAGEWNVLRF